MTCSTCRHWSPKTDKPMAKQWLAPCLLGPRWTYQPPQGKCNEHRPAPADVVQGRKAWLGKAV